MVERHCEVEGAVLAKLGKKAFFFFEEAANGRRAFQAFGVDPNNRERLIGGVTERILGKRSLREKERPSADGEREAECDAEEDGEAFFCTPGA